MGQTTRGIYPDGDGWQVDKVYRGTRLRQRGFGSHEEAERWLIGRLGERRAVVVHGERPTRLFIHAAAHYVQLFEDKVSLDTEVALLKKLMPYVGHLELPQVHDATLAPYVEARLKQGIAHKTINLALGLVRHILRLAALSWRDGETGQTWLATAPIIKLLPLIGHQREPYPISWAQQRMFLPKLLDHLARMSLFILNTGARDDVVCNLRWEWEIKVPELGISVFEVPRRHVKGRRRVRMLVCNSVAQSVVESVRGMHPEFVFVYRKERVTNLDLPAKMAYRPITRMSNSGWDTARTAAGLDDLHVHDLRHTVGMRLREAGVSEGTISDLLWHAKKNVTQHYTMAQIVELHTAIEKVKEDSGRWNKTLATLRREQEEARLLQLTPPEVTQQRKTG